VEREPEEETTSFRRRDVLRAKQVEAVDDGGVLGEMAVVDDLRGGVEGVQEGGRSGAVTF
jgi:hypothetical protein